MLLLRLWAPLGPLASCRCCKGGCGDVSFHIKGLANEVADALAKEGIGKSELVIRFLAT